MSGKKKLPPIHPGEILKEEFLSPLGLSQTKLARGTKMSPRRINAIVQGKQPIDAKTALRLSRFFGTSENFWLNLQVRYDLETARDELGDRLEKEVNAYAG
jgi:addiction module HigA family antidote